MQLSFIKRIKPKTAVLIAGPVILILGLAVFFVWRAGTFDASKAEANVQKWRTFQEESYGFSMRFPSSWTFDYAYDRYATGLLDIDVNNKKDMRGLGCADDYIDLKIFVGKNPADVDVAKEDLKSALYREIELIKKSGNADLVEAWDANGQEAYKIKSEEPTLSLNGVCPGPLYLVDTGNNAFVYIFAGMGKTAKAFREDIVKQIISSIAVAPAPLEESE